MLRGDVYLEGLAAVQREPADLARQALAVEKATSRAAPVQQTDRKQKASLHA